jgi:hypothetical protein
MLTDLPQSAKGGASFGELMILTWEQTMAEVLDHVHQILLTSKTKVYFITGIFYRHSDHKVFARHVYQPSPFLSRVDDDITVNDGMTVVPDPAKHPQNWKEIELGVKPNEHWAEIQPCMYFVVLHADSGNGIAVPGKPIMWVGNETVIEEVGEVLAEAGIVNRTKR